MNKENQRITVTKRMLKESMLRLLKKKDLDNISVTELCRDAGINRATFYRHYQIPRDVLIEIEMDLYYGLKERIDLPKKPDEVRPAIESLCCYLDENIDILRVTIQSNTDMDFAMFVNRIYEDLWNEIHQIGVLQNFSIEDAQILSMYCAGGVYFILRQWLLGNIQKSPKQMADYVYALLNKSDWIALGSQLGFLPE